MTKNEADLIITEQNKSTEEILKAVAKVKADYHELCRLKNMQSTELEKENEKLEKRLSVLLSCKNCPDNKGSFICQKEYEDKCLTQKIQYIKELKEENTELEKENAELKEQIKELKKRLEMGNKVYNDNLDYSYHIEESLTKAKELIRMVIDSYKHKERFSFEKDLMKAEAFLKEESK